MPGVPSALGRKATVNVQAAQARPRPDLRNSGNYTGGKQINMRPLGPSSSRSPSPNPTSSGVPVVTGTIIPPTSNGTSSSSNGIVVARRTVKDVMPAVRAAAAQAAVALPAYRPDGTISMSSMDSASSIDIESVMDRPSDADFKWAQDSYSVLQRTVDTWSFITLFRTRLWLLDQKWSYPGGFTETKKKERSRSIAKYLLSSVLELGPTFIKLGQLSSTRSDLFPAEFTEELTKLQDRVPAFTYEKAKAIIEQDLGRPLDQLFRSFDPRPIAAASLGQVHRAELFTGEQVVVKIQRPGLKQLFDIDLNNLRILAEQLDKGDEANRDFKGIYAECAQVLYEEIDYINEGKNADRFRRNFRDVPWVKVPVVYWEYCSPRVLCMQYLPGVKVSAREQLQAIGLDTDVIARRTTEAYLIQILKHGFYHADPHPGNVSVDRQGNLLYYDMGMMGTIVPDIRERLTDLFGAIYRKDTPQVVNTLVQLGVIKPNSDMLTLRRAVAYFIDNLNKQAERQETLGKIGEDLFAVAVDQPIRFPANFVFVLRAFSTLEGIGKTLNPDYQFSAVATPYAQELLNLQDGDRQNLLVTQLQQQATELGSAAAAMPLRVQRMDSLLASVENGDIKLRVRVLEAERAARRAGVMQAATMNVVGAMGFMNIGTMLALNNLQGPATASLGLAAVFSFLTYSGFKRVDRLDKFEKDIRG